MPLKRRTRVPRRGRRTSIRKRRLTRRRRLVARFKKRKSITRRTKLTQGFPRSNVATLKYVDYVTDISPHTSPDTPGEGTLIHNSPGLLAFSCNDPGMPDLGSVNRANFPTLYAIKGAFPHQPLGYDQYTMLYENAKVLRSSAKFTLTFATRGGYALGTAGIPVPPAAQGEQKGVDSVKTDAPIANPVFNASGQVVSYAQNGTQSVAITTPLTDKFPSGLYVGVLRVNSLNPLALPQTYTEFLERFKAPLKFVPYLQQMAAYKTVTLYGLYGAPSDKALRSMVSHTSMNEPAYAGRMADMLTLRNGDVPYTSAGGSVVLGRVGCRHHAPQAQFAWQVVVYYPDDTGSYVLLTQAAPRGFIDAVSMRATVNIRYRVRFSKLRQLKQSFLQSTPGINEQAEGGGLPLAGGGTAASTSTAGILDQTGVAAPNNQKALPAREEIAQP